MRSLAFPSLEELHLGSAVGLVDDGGDLRVRCPALRRVHLSLCALAVTALQALPLSGVEGLTLLDCSIYPLVAHPWLAGNRGVTAFGCMDDPLGVMLKG